MINCKTCGKEFKSYHNTQEYCSKKCFKIHRKKYDKINRIYQKYLNSYFPMPPIQVQTIMRLKKDGNVGVYNTWNMSDNQEYSICLPLFQNGGFCFICNSIDVRVIVSHHILGDGSGKICRDDLIIGLCANCHKKYQNPNKNKHCFFIGQSIERSLKC